MLTLPSYETAHQYDYRALESLDTAAQRFVGRLAVYFKGCIISAFNRTLWGCPHQHETAALANACAATHLASLSH